MNTTPNTERPKLKLNLDAKPLTLTTNSNSVITDPAAKKVVVVAKPKSDDIAFTTETLSNVATDVAKVKNKDAQKNTKQEDVASNKVVASPEEILKEKIKRRKKEYFSILTKLKADFPDTFSEDPKLLAIGIDLELKKILNGQFPNNQLNRFFHRYCGSFKYKAKLIEGAQRFHLDGSPASLVTREEVPVMVSKPRFNKKYCNASDTASTVSHEIEPTQ